MITICNINVCCTVQYFLCAIMWPLSPFTHLFYLFCQLVLFVYLFILFYLLLCSFSRCLCWLWMRCTWTCLIWPKTCTGMTVKLARHTHWLLQTTASPHSSAPLPTWGQYIFYILNIKQFQQHKLTGLSILSNHVWVWWQLLRGIWSMVLLLFLLLCVYGQVLWQYIRIGRCWIKANHYGSGIVVLLRIIFLPKQ